MNSFEDSQCFLYKLNLDSAIVFDDYYKTIGDLKHRFNSLEKRYAEFRVVLCRLDEASDLPNCWNPDCVDREYSELIKNGFLFTKPFQTVEFFKMLESNQKQTFLTIVYKFTCLKIEHINVKASIETKLDGYISVTDELFDYAQGISKVPSNKIVSRSFHVVQSSGSGKTKHGLELIIQCNQGLYFVRRNESSTGYPVQPIWVSDFIRLMNLSPNNYQCEFYWLELIYSALLNLNSTCIQESISPLNILNFMELSSSKLGKIFQKNDFSNTKSLNLDEITQRIIELAKNLNLGVESGEFSTDAASNIFPIIIDEASALLKCPNDNCIYLFRTLRRALSRLRSIRGLVTIFMGTKSAMAEFHPYDQDDSARAAVVLRPNEQLFVPRPFVFSHNTDVFVHKIVVDYDQLKNNKHVLYAEMLKFGRPLWYFFSNLCDAMNLSKYKLEMFDSKLYPLNALMVRICVSVSPQGDLVHKMVQSGLATLLYVDVLGLKCFTTFIPEPVVSNSARQILVSEMNMKTALTRLVTEISRGVLQKGQAGELVGRIILLMAMDIGASSDDLVIYKEVHEFLKDLSNSKVETDASMLSEEFLHGFVSFSQFISLEKVGFSNEEMKFEVNQELLLHAFVRGSALILPIRTEGADLVIPVLKSDNTMSCIIIQIKNLAKNKIIPASSVQCREILDKLELDNMKFLNLDKISSPTIPTSTSNTSNSSSSSSNSLFSSSSMSIYTKSASDSATDCEPPAKKAFLEFTIEREYLPIVMQFTSASEENLNIISETSEDNDDDEDSKFYWVEMKSKRSCLWLYGFQNYQHLMQSNEHLLKNLLRGEFHFFNHIHDEPYEGMLTKSQNTKKGIHARLITSNPLANKAFLSFADDQYREMHPKNAKLVNSLKDVVGLKDRINRPNEFTESSITLLKK